MNESPAAREVSARSPIAGCAILIAALAVMAFLIGFSVLTLFRQFNEIAKFTGEKPVPVETTSIDDREPALNELAVRLETFRQELDGDSETSLALTSEDLNLAIAAYAPLQELRGTFRVVAINDNRLRIAISFPLNGKPRFAKDAEPGWVASDSRFLNGVLVAHPVLLKQEIALSVDGIEVSGAKVPPEFIDQMSPYRIAERYLADPVLGPAMAKLTRVEITDGKLIFSRKPGENSADIITNEEVDKGSRRLFTTVGIAACIFLTFAGLVILLGMRAKAKKARNL